MPGIQSLGSVTPIALFYNTEMHKLHVGFTAGAAIHMGQPVKLDSSGNVIPFVGGTDNRALCIGESIHEAVQGDKVTIIMRAYVVMNYISSAAVAYGPIKLTGYDSTNLRPTVATAVVGTDDVWGHSFDSAGAAGTVCRVALLP